MSMRILNWADLISPSGGKGQEAAMTIGVFDGIHLGHRELIRRIVETGPNPTVITFRENPKKLISPLSYEGDITTLKQKIAIFEDLGVESLLLIDFSEDFSKLKGREFIRLLQDPGGMSRLVIGEDFRCGHRQDTDARDILAINSEAGLPTDLVPPVLSPLDGTAVSSSQVRRAITSGDLWSAAHLLGRKVELDLSDLEPQPFGEGGLVYDLSGALRLLPALGDYAVRLHPGGLVCRGFIREERVYLPQRAEKIEVLKMYLIGDFIYGVKQR